MNYSHLRRLRVSCQWLAQNLENPQVVICDCRFQLSDPEWGYRQYCCSHIKGAYYLDLDRDLSSPVGVHGGRHPLPDVNQLSQKFTAMGIVRDRTLVVVYDDSRLAFAARLWWLLNFLGHQSVAVLDGGWPAWQAGGYEIESATPEPGQGSFSPEIQPDKVVNREEVKIRKDLPSTLLIDSRARERYLGIREPIDLVAGSIPGAINAPWKQVTDDKGYLQPIEAQRQLWSNCDSAEEIIVYCGSGVTACVNLLSLELAGIEGAKLYLGGWSDWCSHLIRD
ncbi:sulfurtransferase [Myxosarcina sp. GI1(2024)]